MAKQLALIIDCAPLADDGSGKRVIEISLSIAMVAGDGEITDKADVAGCQPWKWDAVGTAITLYGRKNSGNFSLIGNFSPIALTKNDDLPARLTLHISRLFERAGKDPDAFLRWKVGDGAGQQADRIWFPAILADLAHWPPALSRSAGLTFTLVVPSSTFTDLTDIVAVPSFARQAATPFKPGAITMQGALATCSYSGGDGLPATAYVKPAPLAALPSAGLIDFGTRWLTVPSPVPGEFAWHGHDVTAEIRVQAAEGFADGRLAEVVLAKAEQEGGEDLRKLLELDRGVRWRVHAARRVLFGLATTTIPAADGHCLAGIIIDAGIEAIRRDGEVPPGIAPARAAFMASLRTSEALLNSLAFSQHWQTGDDADPTDPAWTGCYLPFIADFKEAYGSVAVDAARRLTRNTKSGLDALPLHGEHEQWRQLVSAVGAGEPLRQFIGKQWKRVPNTTGDDDFRRAVKLGLAADSLSASLLVRRLQAAMAGSHLNAALALDVAVQGGKTPRQNFINNYQRKIRECSTDPNRLNLGELERDGGLLPALAGQALDEAAESQATERVLPAADLRPDDFAFPEIGDDSPTAAPHALSLVIDALRQQPADGSGYQDSDDYRRIAGLGVLIRQLAKDGDPLTLDKFDTWRSLNLANVFVRQDEDPWNPNLSDPNEALALSAVVAYGVSFQGGTSQPVILYDGESLVAEDPTLASYGVGQPKKNEIPELRYGPALQADGTLDERAKLPALRFGQVYETAAFAITNGGALPQALAATTDDPTVLKTTIDTGHALDQTDLRRQYRYLRRVRVGEPRLLDRSGTDNKPGAVFRAVRWQQGATGVRPLADELEWPGRPAGLDQRHRVRFFFADDYGKAGTLDLPSLAGPRFGFEVLAIDTSMLAGATLSIALIETGKQAPPAPIVSVAVSRNGAAVNAQVAARDAQNDPMGLSGTATLDLSKVAAGDRDRILVDLIFNPSPARYPGSGDDGWRVLLRASGAALWDQTSDFASYVAIAPIAAGGASIPGEGHGLALRCNLDGGNAPSVAFGRPTARIDQQRLAADGKPDVPLVVMASKTANTSLPDRIAVEAALPSVDLATWFRWVDMDAFQPKRAPALGANGEARRKHAVEPLGPSGGQFLRHICVRVDYEEAVEKGSIADLSLDDPAVSLRLLLRLVPVHTRQGPRPVKTRMFELDAPAGTGEDVASVRAARLPLTLSAGASPDIVADGTVTIPEGEIWELQIESLVHEGWFLTAKEATYASARFPDRVRDGLPTWADDDGTVYVRMSPARLRIEVAALDMPGESDVFALMTPRFDGSALSVDWGPKPAQTWPLETFAKMANVAAVDLLRQSWRWEGRSFAPVFIDKDAQEPTQEREAKFLAALFAFTDHSIDTDETTLRWERWAFADRDPLDLHSNRTPVALPPRHTEIFRRDMEHDRRAGYHRFAARAYSRYATVAPQSSAASAGVLGKRPSSGAKTETDDALQWRRQMVPSRLAGDLAKPAIKMVVPLTTGGTDAGGATGFLVVVDEPWFEHGGLGERLEVQLALASRPDLTADVGWTGPTSLPEAGPDPILSGEAFPLGDATRLDFVLDGPLGQTQDELAATITAFASVSFIVRPVFAGVPPRLLEWSFLKLAFRRVVPGVTCAPLGGYGKSDAVSPWTIAEWHQMLPDWRLFRLPARPGKPTEDDPTWQVDAADTRLSFDVSADGLHFRRAGVEVIPWPRPSIGYASFGLWVMLTRRVYSAAGVLEGERYVGLYEYRPGNDKYATVDGPEPKSTIATGGLVARLIELQFHNKGTNGKPSAIDYRSYPEVPSSDGRTGWQMLLPAAGDGTELERDATARIVRVSPPIASS